MRSEIVNMICLIYGLPAKSNDIMLAILDLLDKENKIFLVTATKNEIMKATGKSLETINKYIGLLVEYKLLLRQERSYYKASSKLFTTSWKDLVTNDSRLRLSITFNKDSEKIIRLKVFDPIQPS